MDGRHGITRGKEQCNNQQDKGHESRGAMKAEEQAEGCGGATRGGSARRGIGAGRREVASQQEMKAAADGRQ